MLLLAFFASSEAVVESLSSPLDADRIPVLLVPGWGDEAVHVLPLRDRLAEAGWPAGGISMLAFVDPFGSNGDHDSEVAVAV